MNNDNIIGERIKELRNRAGEKQTTLARAIYVCGSSVTHYENGERIPDAVTIAAIAKHYNVSADYLLGLTDEAWKIRGNCE